MIGAVRVFNGFIILRTTISGIGRISIAHYQLVPWFSLAVGHPVSCGPAVVPAGCAPVLV